MFENLRVYSTVAVRFPPSLAQLSAPAVPLGSHGRGRRGPGHSNRPPPLFAGATAPGPRRGGYKGSVRSCGGDLSPSRGPRNPHLPNPSSGCASGAGTARPRGTRPCAAGNVSRMGSGGRGAAPPARPRVLHWQPRGTQPPLPQRFLPLTLTFRDGLRWALPLFAARTPSRLQGDAGGEAEPPSPGGRGPAVPELPPGAGRLHEGR